MSISQHEAVSLINHTIFRPGWRISARPGNEGQVQVGIEIETVDSSFVTRAGEFRVPLTERALILVRPGDYATPEALLFRVLAFIRELQDHEDREFLRTWDAAAERWTAPFHSHAPEGVQAWAAMQALPRALVKRVSLSGDGPWLPRDAGCDMEEDRGDSWESGNGKQATARAAGCEDGLHDQDCWENGKRALVNGSAGCADNDDDPEEGPQRALAGVNGSTGCEEGGYGDDRCWDSDKSRALVNAGCADGIDIDESGCNTNGRHRMLAHAMARPVAADPCTEDHGGCAEWG